MLEILDLTEDNVAEVAKQCAYSEQDLKFMVKDGVKKIYIDKPDIPEGWGRTY